MAVNEYTVAFQVLTGAFVGRAEGAVYSGLQVAPSQVNHNNIIRIFTNPARVWLGSLIL